MVNAELFPILFACIALVLAGSVKGMVGVGFPLVAMSFMTVILDPLDAIALVSIPVFATNAWQAFYAKNLLSIFKRFWPLIVTIMLGTWVGALLVAQINTNILLTSIGIAATIFSVYSLLSPNIKLEGKVKDVLSPVVGTLAGVLGGLTTAHGPLVMMYLMALDLKKEDFIGTVGLVWFCASLPMIAAYFYSGVLGTSASMYSLLALIPTFVGLIFGQAIRGRINQKVFRKVLIFVLLIIGLNLIRRGVF